MPDTVWRCKRCGSLVTSSKTNVVACPCGSGWGEWGQVEVVPLGTAARLRRMEEALKDCCYMFEWCDARYGSMLPMPTPKEESHE